MPDVVDHALDFARLYPKCGAPRDISADDDVLKEAEFSRQIAATYWPPAFAQDIGFDFSCFVYNSYTSSAFADWAEDRPWIGMSISIFYALAEFCTRTAASFPLPDVAQAPPVKLAVAEGTGFRLREPDFGDPIESNREFFRQASQFPSVRLRVLNTLWSGCLSKYGDTRCFMRCLAIRAISNRGLGYGRYRKR